MKMLDRIKNGSAALVQRLEGWKLSLRVRVFATAASFGSLVAAGCATCALAQLTQSGRSSFAYVDERAGDGRHYRAPKIDADPTDLSIEELRARVSALEERMERLDALLLGQQAARAQMEERVGRALNSKPAGKP